MQVGLHLGEFDQSGFDRITLRSLRVDPAGRFEYLPLHRPQHLQLGDRGNQRLRASGLLATAAGTTTPGLLLSEWILGRLGILQRLDQSGDRIDHHDLVLDHVSGGVAVSKPIPDPFDPSVYASMRHREDEGVLDLREFIGQLPQGRLDLRFPGAEPSRRDSLPSSNRRITLGDDLLGLDTHPQLPIPDRSIRLEETVAFRIGLLLGESFGGGSRRFERLLELLERLLLGFPGRLDVRRIGTQSDDGRPLTIRCPLDQTTDAFVGSARIDRDGGGVSLETNHVLGVGDDRRGVRGIIDPREIRQAVLARGDERLEAFDETLHSTAKFLDLRLPDLLHRLLHPPERLGRPLLGSTRLLQPVLLRRLGGIPHLGFETFASGLLRRLLEGRRFVPIDLREGFGTLSEIVDQLLRSVRQFGLLPPQFIDGATLFLGER